MDLKDRTLNTGYTQLIEILEHWFCIAVIQSKDNNFIAPINKQMFKRTSALNEPCEGHMITVKSVFTAVNGDDDEHDTSRIIFNVYDDYLEETFKRPFEYFNIEELLYLANNLKITGYDPRSIEE